MTGPGVDVATDEKVTVEAGAVTVLTLVAMVLMRVVVTCKAKGRRVSNCLIQ